MNRFLSLLLFFSFFTSNGYAQTVANIGDAPGSNFCLGTLYDSGGPTGDYSDGENLLYTICPDVVTECIEVTIGDYMLEEGVDFLNIYAGKDANGISILTLSGTGNHIVVNSPLGCVTMEFISNGANVNAGFDLTWACSSDACDTPPFSTCATADIISNTPFTADNLTTCNAGNFVNGGPCNEGNYMNGNEYLFQYTSPGNECVSLGVTGAIAGTGISIFNDCPDVATTCIAQTGNTNIAFPYDSFTYLENPGTYYIAIANNLGCTPFSLTFDALELDEFSVTPDTAVCVGAQVQLFATGGLSYEWTPATGLSCTDCANPIATPNNSTEYQVTAFGPCDTFSETVTVDILKTGVLQDATVCMGEVNELYVGPQSPNITYTWNPTTDLSCADCPNPMLTANTIGSTTYTVTIETLGGCFVTDSFVWTVLNNAAPDFSVADDAQLCIGDNVNIGGPQNASTTYSWTSNPPGFTNTTSNPNVAPSVTTQYFLQANNTSCMLASFDSVLVEVATPPVLNIAANTTLCLGTDLQMGSISRSEQEGVTYSWSPTTDLVDATDPNTDFSPTSFGDFTYTLTAVRGGCTVTETVDITVIEIALDILNADTVLLCLDDSVELLATSLPAGVNVNWSPATWLDTTVGNSVTSTALADILYTATISNASCTYTESVLIQVDSLPEVLSILPQDTVVCQGSIVELITPTYETREYPDIEFLWTPDAGFESSDTLLNMVIRASTTETFTRTTTHGGCISLDTVQVIVNPIEMINIIPPEPVICPGGSVDLDSDADDKMLENIIWMPPTGLSCMMCSDPTANPTSTTTYAIAAEDPNGCPVMGSVTVTVQPPPDVTFPANLQCVGATVALNSGPVLPENTYSWTSSDPNFSSNDPNPVVTLTSDVTYFVTVNNGICEPNSREITFSVVQVPEFTVSPDITICSGDVVTLTATGTESGTYTWVPGPDNSSIDIAPTTTTNYVSTYTWGPDCGTFTEEVLVTVEEGFDVFINANPDSTIINEGQSIALVASINPPTTDITNYAWTANGTPIGTNSPTLMDQPPTVNNTPTTIEYKVVATSANGCTSETTYTILVVPPPFDIPSAFTPNGDGENDIFALIYEGEIDMESFQIFNRWGQKVFETNDIDTGWDGRHKGTLAPSDVYVYLVKLNLLSGQEILQGDVTLIR